MPARIAVAAAFVLALANAASAQTTILVVRHAERADSGSGGMASDPELSAAGRARADSLAAMLKDEKLTAVYATEYKRTQQTAAPTAAGHGLTTTTVKAADTPALLERLKAAKGAVLVVGHSNTVVEVLKGLGVATPVSIPESEFDNLFIVTTGGVTGEKPSFVHLRYR